MVSIFLCHSSKDKPFVEKLANNLQQIGIKVWFDKYEIKVGESITRKINEGLKSHEYLGIILSPDSVNSEWVWGELGPKWYKQTTMKKIIVLPILYRDCTIPEILKDRKYADFRKDFNRGFEELARSLGVKEDSIVSADNWRKFKRKNKEWKKFREKEYRRLVTKLVDLVLDYKWSVWTGGKNKFTITLYADYKDMESISLILDKKSDNYFASFKMCHNPNNLRKKDFSLQVGNSVNECEEFVWRRLENIKNKKGIPTKEPSYFIYKHPASYDRYEVTKKVIEMLRKHTSYYDGEKLDKYPYRII